MSETAPPSSAVTIPPIRSIHVIHRGRITRIDDAAPTRTLLDWLREDARPRCTGTKEGCNEGDCGACTVLVAERDDTAPGGVALRNVNACLSFLPTLDGRAILTVEDLPQPHPVQQALVACHGSQCGFCTPGFVMTMTALREAHAAAGTRPERPAIADALAGNLCRCTGYRPIVDAAEHMFALPDAPIDRAALRAQLDALQAGVGPRLREGDGIEQACMQVRAEGPCLREGDGVDSRHPREGGDPRSPVHAGEAFHAPRTLDELAALRLAHPEARLLAGGTDIALWVNKQFRELGRLIWTGGVTEMRRITTEADGTLHIGAAASLEDAWAALAARWPALTEVWRRFASPPVRHAGTLGGNIANGSPIGDGAPVLIALGARIVLRRGPVTRTLALEDFYLDYMKNALTPGEFVERLVVPPQPEGTQLRAWKISKRFDSDISTVLMAAALRLDADGRIAAARLAFGGMAAITKRAAQTEAALRGRRWDETTLQAAQVALAQDFRPLSDLRASASYRLAVSANLLRRLWLETRPDDPLPASATQVREFRA